MRTHGAVVSRRFRSITKLATKVRIGRGYLWGSLLTVAAALKTPTRNGYNAQGVNLKSIYINIYVAPGSLRLTPLSDRTGLRIPLGPYTILFHSFLCVHDSIIPSLPPPISITHTTAILLRDCCAIYDPPPTLPVYAIRHTILVMTISCKG